MRRLAILSSVLAGVWFTVAAAASGVYRIRLDQPIHPITSEYVVTGISTANDRGATLILLVVDTPGGYVKSVEEIQRAILASRAPVVVYVAPPGARAASGGAFVALASDLIAMAKGTSIGAAHPVSALPLPVPSPPPIPAPAGDEGGPKPKPKAAEGAVEMEKVVNDLAAHMRSLAQNRNRNVDLAEKMVRESLSLTEKEALDGQVIELVADNEGQIFAYLGDHPVRRFEGQEERVALGETPAVSDLTMTLREQLLSALANPSLAYILLLMGALGLFVEFKSPGLIFPGVLGGIFILLYLMSIPLLPPNVVGLLLIALGLVFFILEVKVVSYGMLAIGGVISLLIGSMLLYSRAPVPELKLSLMVIVPVVVAFAGIIIFLVTLAAKAFKNPVVTGEEGILGQEGEVRQAIEPPGRGKVFLFGEYWSAESTQRLEAGVRIKVVGREGMTLRVEPLE
jgi:membrane-bound serine protease (ClpP class)